MAGYWTSTEALERKRLDRWLRTVRAIVDLEPRRKPRSRAGRARQRGEAPLFRDALRKAIALRPGDWPKPRAPIALDLNFTTAERQPPSLWELPKNYLDLLGATSAPAHDPGPLLFKDDAQVKLLFASLHRAHREDAVGRISVVARSRTYAVDDMQLAGELLQDDDELESDARWAEADPSDVIDDDYRNLPLDLADRVRRDDIVRYQAMVLGSNDRLIRHVFFQAARWLLTGVDRDINRLQRIGAGMVAVEDIVNRIVGQNAEDRELLWSTVRIELPSLPLHPGDSERFRQGVHEAFRTFVEDRLDLHPVIAPLRVTVLVIPPLRRLAATKDLDNILITVLKILEKELRSGSGSSSGGQLHDGPSQGSQLCAYQIIELHRQPADSDHGSLVLIPGLGWNRQSVWSEAEDYVERRLQRLIDETW